MSFPRLGLWVKCSVIIVLVFALSSCSRSFGYRFADTYAMWQVRGYVSLDREQRRDLRAEINALLQWHAEQEMPEYHALLAQLRDDITHQRIETDVYQSYQIAVDERWSAVRQQLMAPALGLLPRLSDAQADELVASIRERISEQEQESLDKSAEQRAQDNADSLAKQAERWLGRLNDEQRQLLQDWTADAPSMASYWFEYRRRWADEFAAALSVRNNPAEFEDTLQVLIVNPEQLRPQALNDLLEESDTFNRNYMFALADTLSAQQRDHLVRALGDTQTDLTRMARTRGVTIN